MAKRARVWQVLVARTSQESMQSSKGLHREVCSMTRLLTLLAAALLAPVGMLAIPLLAYTKAPDRSGRGDAQP